MTSRSVRHLKFRSCAFDDARAGLAVLHFRHPFGHYADPEGHRSSRDFFKLTWIVSGEAECCCNDIHFPLKPGYLFLVHPDDQTSYDIHTPVLEIFDLIFSATIAAECQRNIIDHAGLLCSCAPGFQPKQEAHHVQPLIAGEEAGPLIRRMFREQLNRDPNSPWIMLAYLKILLAQLCRVHAKKRYQQLHQRLVEIVDRQIEQRFSGPFHLRDVALELQITPTHLSRSYRERTGITISQALRKRRLQEVLRLFSETEWELAEIAKRSGFADLSHFYRLFREVFHTTPAEYRRARRHTPPEK